jgi:TolB-like protein
VGFDRFRFEPSTGLLWEGPREIKLTPKTASVLAFLVARPGELVSRQELFASSWHDVIVGDDALTSCIQELRKALGDDVRHPRFIETRHRRGYRFIAPVMATAGDEVSSAVSHARDAAPAGTPTIAVLPFLDVGDPSGREHFADAITDDIITALSKYRSLLVIARSSTFALKSHSIDARRLGVDLHADYAVEGSVARSSRHLRITARLVETQYGGHVWAERYDRTVEDVFRIQDEIVSAIAGRIEPEVETVERRRAEEKSPQAFRAWDFFHLGMKHFYEATADGNREAQRLLRRAIDLDPTLAQAHAWMSYAIVLSMIYFDVDADAERLDQALGFAQRAVELAEQDAVAHFAYGRVLLARKEYAHALSELESAAELNPCLAVAHCGLGDSLAYEGRIREAIPHFEKAISLSPFDPNRWAFLSYRALAHLFAGEFENAVDWANRAIRIPRCHYWPFAHRVSALGHLRRVDALETARSELLQRKADFSREFARRRLFFIKDPSQLDLYLEGLSKAGIPA